jgi:hypothetical protein
MEELLRQEAAQAAGILILSFCEIGQEFDILRS